MAPTPPPREHVACNLCGADDTTPYLRLGEAQLVRCRRCGLVYTNPRPPLVALTAGYEEDYSADHQAPELLRQRRLMYALERRDLLRQARQGRFLDIGCGTGEFLAALGEGFEPYGVDVSRTYVRYGAEHFGLTNLHAGELTEAGFAAEFFDVAQLRGVLQHLPDPLGQLREAWRVLKPGGLLVVSATPNIASPAARAFGSRFRLLAPDQMLYDFSPATLRAILRAAGFTPRSLHYPYLGTPYWHWYDGFSFIAGALRGRWARLRGHEEQAPKSPPFPGSMMTCYAVKSA